LRLIVEADGGSRGNPGPAAYGALVRDAGTGDVLVEVCEAIGVATNNVAEYRGVIAGLSEAKKIDPDATVEARLDSKLIVEQMSGRWKIKNPDLKPLALEVRRIFPAERVTYTWVPRERNTHADRLVNKALDGEPSRPAAARAKFSAAPGVAPAEQAQRAPRLYLVRHGQTADTVARLFAGGSKLGAPLDEVGLKQAQTAADALSQTGAVAVIASPMLRAQQTAEPIAGRLGLEIITDPEWREVEFGEWEGRAIADVIATSPSEAAAWRGSTSVRTPGGESLADMAARVIAARDRLLADYTGQPVVVVTHSMPIRSLVVAALGAPLDAIHQLRPGTGSITELRVGEDGFVLTGFSLT
jgi:probable phosphoglycerate mutase